MTKIQERCLEIGSAKLNGLWIFPRSPTWWTRGGGDRTNLITLAGANRSLRGRVFDLLPVCEIARRIIAVNRLSDRLNVVFGNCFESDFPRNAEVFFAQPFFFDLGERERPEAA